METIKKNSVKITKENIETLENLFLSQKVDDNWLNDYRENSGQTVDVAIATLSQYNNKLTIKEICNNEELDNESNYDAALIRIMTAVHSLWVDKKAIIERTDNMIDAPTEINWKTLFNHAVVKLVLAEGRLMSFNASYYGWGDYNSKLKNEDIVAVFNLQEDYWDEFEGTFVTSQDSHTGFKCEVMFNDGTFRELRFEGDMAEIIRKIT